MTTRPAETVLVRCDVGPTLGVGHLMRCAALAEEFQARGATVVFAADAGSVPFAAAQLAARGIRHVAPPGTPEEHVELARSLGARVVVVDSYLLGPDVYDALRAAGVVVLALVDGDPAGRAADLYLDQNIGAEHDVWELAPGAVRLAGLDHALMRDDIRALRPATPERAPAEVPEVLAVFGGTDAYAAAPVLARALVATGAPFHLTVVAAREETRAELEALAAGPLADGQSVTVIAPTERIAELVVAADLVVSAAGTSSWELMCLGAACALVCVADNQVESYGRAVEAGLADGLGYLEPLRSGPQAVVDLLRDLLTTPDRRQALRERGWAAVDGRGRQRVVDALGLLVTD